MKKRSGTVLLITAIILALIMAGVYFYAPVSFKYPLVFGLGTVTLVLINIINYSENSKVSPSLLIPLGVIAAAFAASFFVF